MARPTLARAVRWVNYAIAALLAVALAAAYWYAWRPLPQTTGVVEVPLSAVATVGRDRLGVPHIRAATLEDALFVQGYVTAQDRLWQMDGLRRLAAGDLAEIIGRAGLEADRESRRLRMRHIAEEASQAAPLPDRAAFAAYARGVNEFIRTHRTRLPVEFTVLGYSPRPWSVVDCVLVGLHMYRTLTTTWKSELLKSTLLAAGDPARVEALFPPRGRGADVLAGSNAWVLSGRHTASGKPLLANDMHLDYSLPGLWFAVHIETPGYHAAGVSLPGLPGVMVGHNARIAWGITNLGYDVQDLYLERFDERSGLYFHRGRVEQARREKEIIAVRGAPAEEMTVWSTRHGPLLAGTSQPISLRWSGADAAAFQFPFLDIGRAANWSQFTAALARLPGPASNFVYADVDGNIGFQVAGRLPRRMNYTGDVPVDGVSGSHEWTGFIPFEQLPTSYNPPEGILVTANQDPFPAAYPHRVHGSFAAPYRARQIGDRLRTAKRWTAPDTFRVQMDVYSPFCHFLARQIVAAAERHPSGNPGVRQAAGLLREWNGQMDRDIAQPLIATLAFQHLRRAVGDRAAPGKGGLWVQPGSAVVIEQMLRGRPPGWFPDWDAQLVRALEDAVDEGSRMQGKRISRWAWGNHLQFRLPHPVLDRLPLAGRRLGVGPVGLSGSTTSVKQTTSRMGPSMRMAVDLAEWDRSLLTLAVGESGHPLSRHYRDQWKAWYYGTGFPMQFSSPRLTAVLRFEPAR